MMVLPCNDRQHELTPAFFSPEVLLRYQQIPSRYEVSEGSIRCNKAGWILQSCYLSSANEVYCYLCDLALLPESEQDYWKAFNLQIPIGSECETAVSRDFFAEFAEEMSGLSRLRRALNSLEVVQLDNADPIPIWQPKEGSLDEMISKVHPPLIDDFEVYRSFIGALARASTEGLDGEAIKKWASSIGASQDPQARSLGTLKACLRHLSTTDIAQKVHQPLHKLHREKSAISSHGGKRSVANRSYIQDGVKWLCEVTEAFEKLSKIVRERNSNMLSTQKPPDLKDS